MKTSKLAFGAVLPLLMVAACSGEPAANDTAAGDETAAAATDENGPPPPAEEAAAAPATETAAAPTVSNAAGAKVIEGITNKRLSFASGTNSARIEGSIKGDETIDYLLNVRAGQSMNISMGSKNASAYFNLLEPGEDYVAIFNGSNGENMFEGTAAKNGDYRIRVYLYRNAARRGEKADYVLEAGVN